MRIMTAESVATPTLPERAGTARPFSPRRAKARPIRWGALYSILAASVGLCVGGSRLVAAFGHPALFQYAVALAILGLLGAWIRKYRSALSQQAAETHGRLEETFSVIRVAFSAKSAASNQGTRMASSAAERPDSPPRPLTTLPHQ